MKLLCQTLSIVLLAAIHGGRSHAETRCEMVRRLADDLGCGFGIKTVETKPDSNYLVRGSFTSGRCLMAEKLKKDKANQTANCEEWLSKRRAELGKRFVTGSCQMDCEPCPSGLTRCTVQGEAHYNLEQ